MFPPGLDLSQQPCQNLIEWLAITSEYFFFFPRRGVWLSSCSRQNEGKGGQSQVQAGEVIRTQAVFAPGVAVFSARTEISLHRCLPRKGGVPIAWSGSREEKSCPWRLVALQMQRAPWTRSCLSLQRLLGVSDDWTIEMQMHSERLEMLLPSGDGWMQCGIFSLALFLFLHMPALFVVAPACCASHDNLGLNMAVNVEAAQTPCCLCYENISICTSQYIFLATWKKKVSFL